MGSGSRFYCEVSGSIVGQWVSPAALASRVLGWLWEGRGGAPNAEDPAGHDARHTAGAQ